MGVVELFGKPELKKIEVVRGAGFPHGLNGRNDFGVALRKADGEDVFADMALCMVWAVAGQMHSDLGGLACAGLSQV